MLSFRACFAQALATAGHFSQSHHCQEHSLERCLCAGHETSGQRSVCKLTDRQAAHRFLWPFQLPGRLNNSGPDSLPTRDVIVKTSRGVLSRMHSNVADICREPGCSNLIKSMKSVLASPSPATLFHVQTVAT